MPSPKNLLRWGVTAKIEATEGTFVAPSLSTDGILVVERPDVVTDWIHKGERAHSSLKRVARAGRGHTVPLVLEPAGAGVAYSPTVLPSIHTIARICGLDAAIDTTAGAEKVTYTPSAPGTYASGSTRIFSRVQQYDITATHGQLKLEVQNGGIPRLTADLNGISNAKPIDLALPAVTYAGSQLVDPAVATNMSLTLGAFSPQRIKSIVLTQELGWAARYLDNTGKHGGFNPGADAAFTLDVVVEAEVFANYDPYTVAEAATSAAMTANFGVTGSYKWHQLTAANCQLVDLPEQDENNAALWALKYELKPSTFMGLDYFSWIFPK